MINGNPKYEWSCTVSRYLFWRKANRMRYKQFLTSGRLEMEFFSYSRFDHCIQHTVRLIKRTLKLLYTKREVEKSHHSSSWKISNDVDERSHLQHLWWEFIKGGVVQMKHGILVVVALNSGSNGSSFSPCLIIVQWCFLGQTCSF